MGRATINSSTFITFFKDREDLLARLAASLTRCDYKIFANNITSDPLNEKKVGYVMKMPDDNTIKLINTKNKDVRVFKLKK